ncbi:MAG: nucleotidyltransferase family protein, partial [Colwellia sp.]
MKYTLKYEASCSLNDAVKALDNGGVGFLALVDDSNKLLGILTDGDLRRAILNKETELNKIINFSPAVMSYQSTSQEVIQKLKSLHRRHMPLVDEENRLKSVFTLDDVDFVSKDNEIIIMAGGLGSRLGELTKETPKPMLRVGDKPMLQHLIEQFRDQGFCKFILCVNYKKDIISDYFGSGEKFGVQIDYVVETKRLGTAGALSLIQKEINSPFFVINADVLTSLNFQELISFHKKQKSKATMCVRNYVQQVPYGVIKADENSTLIGIDEKPTYSFNVNTGIYVLEPSVL